MDKRIIEEKLYKEAMKSFNNGDVPVGAILGHAEINCILKATKKLKTWHLDNCDLYVTLKPCSICTNIINNSRISNVYYYLDKDENKKEYNKTSYKQINELFSIKISNLLTLFFKNKR